jgi:hypothetical protein
MYVRKPTSLATNRIPKNAGTIYLMCLGQYEVSKKGSQNGLRNRFLSSVKRGPGNRKKGFHASRPLKN